MAQTIQIKRNNSNAATVPSSLLTGELAVNLLDRALYSSDGTDVVKLYTGTDKWFTSAGVANVAAKVSNKLTFGSKTYDGSAAKTITASDLGALTSHQSIYALTINNSAGTAQVTYTPNSKAASLTLTKAMVGLGNVENTALSTWAGSTKITTVGTITSGTWNGTKIANGYLANSSVTIAGTSVSLGGSITQAALRTALGLGSNAYTSTDYLPLSGGVIKGVSPYHQYILTLNTDNAYYSILRFQSGGTDKGRLQWANDTNHFRGFGLTNDTTGDRLGLSDDGVPFYNTNTLIHSGNIGSYNAGSATKLQTARTIWGQSFDGSANIPYTAIPTMTYVSFNKDASTGIGYVGKGGISDNLYFGGYEGVPITLFSNNTLANNLTIATTGNVGIGTTSPSYKLHVAGVIYTSSNLLAAGDVTSGSDERYKKVISHAEIDINTIANAPIINFKWTDREDARVHLGSTAQYWYGTSLSNGVIPTDDEKLWTMGYGQIALASVVSVAKKVVNHEEEIKNLKKKVNELENELKQYRRA